MTEKIKCDRFELVVPLDASGVDKFKPEKDIKVVIKDAEGTLYSQEVGLDNI